MRGLGSQALTLAVMWSLLFVYALHAAIPYNPVALPFESQLAVWRLLPEGWAFFTRSPREEQLTSHRVGPDARLQAFTLGPHGRAANLFGLNRRSRSEGVEMGLLIFGARQVLGKDPWVPCGDSSEEACVARVIREHLFVGVQNPAPEAHLCGRLVLRLQEPVPWAWIDSPPHMPERILPLDATC